MLLKPVTALAFSAFISFVASSAVAAPTSSSDGKAVATSWKASHHAKKDGKPSKKKKLGHVAFEHSPEPRSSPKLAASMSRPLDVHKASQKGTSPKKATVAATGKEIFIGGPIDHAGASLKAEKPGVDVRAGAVRPTGTLASGSLHVGTGALRKSGREASHPESVAKSDKGEADEHPVAVLTSDSGAKAAPSPLHRCHQALELARGEEVDAFSLTSCAGALTPLADERVSVLFRPESAARPLSIEALAKVKGAQLAPGIRRVDPGLLERVQLIADHFARDGAPTRISIVSGYRPTSTGSYHATAQALDFHVDGVSNEALVEFCKTLEDTGCGYYPNSSFVHVDVRAPKTGHVAWIDASGPGESPRYVTSWPPSPDPDVKIASKDDDKVDSALPPLPGDRPVGDSDKAPAASVNEPLHIKEWE